LLVDYHVHVVAHGEYHYREEWLNQYLDRAQQRGVQAIGLIEHDQFREKIDWKLIEASKRPDLHIAAGLEIDFVPGREESIKRMIDQHPLDFVMGSVHFINDWAFDHPDHRAGFDALDIDQVYSDYYVLIDKLVKSRLFDIIGHLDLIKIWGHRPIKKDSLQHVQPILHSIKASPMVIEINSAGLRKPVQEMYPCRQIIEKMFQLGLPVTMGSDAHHPDQVAEGLADVSRTLWSIGYRKVIAFKGRESYPLPLAL
jgi:histidinol-phosphatase (PHP family)